MVEERETDQIRLSGEVRNGIPLEMANFAMPRLAIVTGLNGSGKSQLLAAIKSGRIRATRNGERLGEAEMITYLDVVPTTEQAPEQSIKHELALLVQVITSEARSLPTTPAAGTSAESQQQYFALEGTGLRELLAIEDSTAGDFRPTDLVRITRERLAATTSDSVSAENSTELSQLEATTQKASAILEEKANLDDQLTTKVVSYVRNFLAQVKQNKIPSKDGRGKPTTRVPQPAERTKALHLGNLQAANRLEDVMRSLSEELVVPVGLASRDQIEAVYPTTIEGRAFQQPLAQWFARWAAENQRNRERQIDNRNGHSDIDYLSDEDFQRDFGRPPWEVVNELLARAGLDLQVKSPRVSDRTPYSATFTSSTSAEAFPLSSLSSGEQAILHLLAHISYDAASDNLRKFPDLLLLDEVDAALHPSLTQFLLDALQRIPSFVIFATHSPSTVALSPSERVFYITSDEGQRRVAAVTRDDALLLLTDGLPRLHVTADSRRQVLVESTTDAEIFRKLYEIEVRRRIIESAPDGTMTLQFIGVDGVKMPGGQGGWKKVTFLVRAFSQAGAQTVFGVIDWDGKNPDKDRLEALNSNPNVKVLADQRKDNIESVLLDPLLIGLLLLNIEVDSADLNMAPNRFPHELVKDAAGLQRLVEGVLAQLPDELTKGERLECTYGNSQIKSSIPVAYLTADGHFLEDELKKVWGGTKQFNGRGGRGGLAETVIARVLKPHPMLIPDEVLDLLRLLEETTPIPDGEPSDPRMADSGSTD